MQPQQAGGETVGDCRGDRKGNRRRGAAAPSIIIAPW